MRRTIAILLASIGAAFAAVPRPNPLTVPAGTIIRVRTNEGIDSSNAATGRVFTAVVAEDATDRQGRIVIPKGSPAELVVRGVNKHQIALDLASVTAQGKRYLVASSSEVVEGTKKPGVGKNKRTAKFLGGGAAAGTVIGAIAGGGTGALVGGLVGGGAGAGAQSLTRKKSARVPSESLLSFRLQQPLVAH
jgi:hypothetical protein